MGFGNRWVRAEQAGEKVSEQVSDHEGLKLPGDMKLSGFRAGSGTLQSLPFHPYWSPSHKP